MRVTSNGIKRARQLRKHMSLPEVMLWKVLRGREPGKPVFRRQHPIARMFWTSSAPAPRFASRSMAARMVSAIGRRLICDATPI